MGIEKGINKILKEAAHLEKGNNLTILAHSVHIPLAVTMIQCCKDIGINAMLIEIPDVLRPMKEISPMLTGAIQRSDALIYLAKRMPEDMRTTFGALWDTCRASNCRYLAAYDPKPWYFEDGGIVADPEDVEKTNDRIVKILKETQKVKVTSAIGTDVSFELTDVITYRSPRIPIENLFKDHPTLGGYVQVPEGEVLVMPAADSFHGKVVVDGAMTGFGGQDPPISLTFSKGRITDAKGDKEFLTKLSDYIKRINPNAKSLIGNKICEFSLGTNRWAKLDDNISNCEKVSGTIHFGYYVSDISDIDNMLTKPTVVITKRTGEQLTLVQDGKLLI